MDILAIIYSGLFGALGMFLLMELITLSGLANADMVRAVGSLVTRKQEGSLKVGILMHLVAGLLFSLLYCTLISLMPVETVGIAAFIGAFGGFVHGFIVSYFLVIEVAERHPLEKYRKAGFEVALAHIVGHIVYGWLVGFAFAQQTIASVASEAASSSHMVQTYISVAGVMALLAMLALSIKNNLHLHK